MLDFHAKSNRSPTDRHEIHERIDRDVEDHAQLHDTRDAQISRLPDDTEREQRRDEIAEAGNEAKDRIEAEAKRRARHRQRGIEQPRNLAKQLEPLFLTGRQPPQARDW